MRTPNAGKPGLRFRTSIELCLTAPPDGSGCILGIYTTSSSLMLVGGFFDLQQLSIQRADLHDERLARTHRSKAVDLAIAALRLNIAESVFADNFSRLLAVIFSRVLGRRGNRPRPRLYQTYAGRLGWRFWKSLLWRSGNRLGLDNGSEPRRARCFTL